MTEPTELLPCPFCGSKATASVNKGESLWSHDVVDWTRVHCTNDDCNAQTEATCEGYEPSAVEVWNTRAVLAKWGAQPVVREPLTDKQSHALLNRMANEADQWADGLSYEPTPEQISGWCVSFIRREIQADHGIKGGQHGGS